MKIVDDKLRIIDDVPSSAVELSVKEKVSKYPKRKAREFSKFYGAQNHIVWKCRLIFHNFMLVYSSVPKESSTARTHCGRD